MAKPHDHLTNSRRAVWFNGALASAKRNLARRSHAVGKIGQESAGPNDRPAPECLVSTARKSVLASCQRAGANRLREPDGTRETIVSTNFHAVSTMFSAQPVFETGFQHPVSTNVFRQKNQGCARSQIYRLKLVSTRFQPNSQPVFSGPCNKNFAVAGFLNTAVSERSNGKWPFSYRVRITCTLATEQQVLR